MKSRKIRLATAAFSLSYRSLTLDGRNARRILIGSLLFCLPLIFVQAQASQCGDGIKVGSEACDDGNSDNDDGCSAACELETPLTFNCALQNDQQQRDVFPDYVSPRANGERSSTSDPQPLSANFEPILEEVPHCNGLPWAPAAENKYLAEYKFLVVLDQSWINYYNENQANFLTQGYADLETSPQILFDRASYLFEAQFGVRIGISRVEAIETLEEACASTGGNVESGQLDATSTRAALTDRGLQKSTTEMGIVRLGIDPPDTYCTSYTGLASWSAEFPLVVNTENPFSESGGLLRNRAAVTLAHELAHFFASCWVKHTRIIWMGILQMRFPTSW